MLIEVIGGCFIGLFFLALVNAMRNTKSSKDESTVRKDDNE